MEALPARAVTLAQSDWGDIALWSVLLIGLVLVGAVFIAWARKAMDPTGSQAPDGFTLHGLRQLHVSGKLSEAEFERAKAALIDRVKKPPSDGEPDPAVVAVEELKGRSDKLRGDTRADNPSKQSEQPESEGPNRPDA